MGRVYVSLFALWFCESELPFFALVVKLNFRNYRCYFAFVRRSKEGHFSPQRKIKFLGYHLVGERKGKVLLRLLLCSHTQKMEASGNVFVGEKRSGRLI
jgi:hypothetical protein